MMAEPCRDSANRPAPHSGGGAAPTRPELFIVHCTLNLPPENYGIDVQLLVRLDVAADDDQYDRECLGYFEKARARAFEQLRPFCNNRTHVDPYEAVRVQAAR